MLGSLFKPLSADEIRQEIINRSTPERPKGRMTIAQEREYLIECQRPRPVLIKAHEVKPAAVPQEPPPKTWVPPSPRAFRTERPTATAAPAPDARTRAHQAFAAVWRDPSAVMQEKRAQLAQHFAK